VSAEDAIALAALVVIKVASVSAFGTVGDLLPRCR
jgi:hypothetical protein